MNIEQALEAIYISLDANNEDIDLHISNLKKAMSERGEKKVVFKIDRIPVQNREGRKTMESYFKKRGVKIAFEK